MRLESIPGIKAEEWLSGRRRSLGKRVWVYSLPQVRILSPPLWCCGECAGNGTAGSIPALSAANEVSEEEGVKHVYALRRDSKRRSILRSNTRRRPGALVLQNVVYGVLRTPGTIPPSPHWCWHKMVSCFVLVDWL